MGMEVQVDRSDPVRRRKDHLSKGRDENFVAQRGIQQLVHDSFGHL